MTWMTLSAIRVAGATSCPTPSAVQRRLDSLAPEDVSPAQVATLENVPHGVKLTLFDMSGNELSRRTFAGDQPCAELANVMALVLASWRSELAPQPARAIPLVSVTSGTASTRGLSWQLAAGVSASFGGGFAPGALLEVAVGPADSPWRVRAMGAFEASRQLIVGPGIVNWQDWQIGVGGAYAAIREPVRLEITGSAILSVLQLAGAQFTVNSSTTSLNPGVNLSARLLLLGGRWHPWIGLGATAWLRQEVPSVQGVASSAALPRLTGAMTAGVAWSSY